MIILDTNVISVLMQRVPDPAVVSWLDEQPADSVWLTTITIFEVRFGLALVAAGRRRHALETQFDQFIEQDLDNRVLDFDVPAADAAAQLAAERQRAGRPVAFRDTQLAGIALARHAVLATRNVRHFNDSGIDLVNPWDA